MPFSASASLFSFIQRDYFASRIALTGESKLEANHGFAEGSAKCGAKNFDWAHDLLAKQNLNGKPARLSRAAVIC
jgi:hypothetical protein